MSYPPDVKAQYYPYHRCVLTSGQETDPRGGRPPCAQHCCAARRALLTAHLLQDGTVPRVPEHGLSQGEARRACRWAVRSERAGTLRARGGGKGENPAYNTRTLEPRLTRSRPAVPPRDVEEVPRHVRDPCRAEGGREPARHRGRKVGCALRPSAELACRAWSASWCADSGRACAGSLVRHSWTTFSTVSCGCRAPPRQRVSHQDRHVLLLQHRSGACVHAVGLNGAPQIANPRVLLPSLPQAL